MNFNANIARQDYDPETGEYISDLGCTDGHFGLYSPAYVTTNEDWRFAIRKLKPAGNTVLCVAGSGDQPIAFAVSGAKTVDTFDVSYFAKVMMDIKTAAINTMDFKQYSDFIPTLYNTTSIHGLNEYCKIENTCDKTSLAAATQMIGCKIFNQGIGAIKKYMPTRTEYKAAQKIINAPMNFIWSDLRHLHTQIVKKYDIIYLSNIFEHFDNAEDITTVLCNLYPYLNPNANIILHASWTHTNISAIIVDAASKCKWGKVQSHDSKNAVMLTIGRTH